MRSFLSHSFALLLAAVFIAPAWSAPAIKGEDKSTKNAAEAIRTALDSTGKFEFADSSLPAAMNTLSEQYKISIVIDRQVIQMMGHEPESMNVDLKMKEGKLKAALRSMLSQYNLTFAIMGESLLITTEEVAIYRQLKQRVSVDYDNVPLNKALKELAAKCGVNVVFDPKVVKSKAAENPVTLRVDDVPFEAAARLMCELAELKPARMGNVILVTTEARADRLKDSDNLVPTPAILNPGLPGVLGAGFGGLALPQPLPAVVLPAVPDKAEAKKDEPKTDEPKKEDPKKD